MNDRDFQSYVLQKLDSIEDKVGGLTAELKVVKTKSSWLGAALGTIFGAFVGWLFKWWRTL